MEKQREIRFRAWDKEQKCMWYGGYVVFGMPLQTNITDLHQTKVGKYPRKDSVLMQFTGLRDRHGVEIYEGDIVKLRKEHRVVGWWEDRGCFGFVYPTGEQLQNFSFDRTGWMKPKIEVIGNIYENPELLTPEADTTV